MTTNENEFTRITVKQNFGPRYVFQGKLIGEMEWPARGDDGDYIRRMAVWESRGGALIASVGGVRAQGAPVRAVLALPTLGEAEQRFAVMELFNWSDRARTLAKTLGWSLTVEVV